MDTRKQHALKEHQRAEQRRASKGRTETNGESHRATNSLRGKLLVPNQARDEPVQLGGQLHPTRTMGETQIYQKYRLRALTSPQGERGQCIPNSTLRLSLALQATGPEDTKVYLEMPRSTLMCRHTAH